MKKIFLFLFLLAAATSFAQIPFVMNGTQTTISHCNLIIYDNGSATGNYGNNRSDSLTILSNDPNNSCVQISILTLDIDPSDTLYIYNGSSSNDPLMVKLNNSNFTTEAIFNYTATIQNPTGALHLVFVTDGAGVGEGFSITTACERPCQRINIHLDTVLSSHVPRLDPRLNDGYYYVNVCPYDTVILQVYGEYIDNNFSYSQSDATSTFKWDLGDTVITGVGLYVMPHKFREGRGYDVSVSIEDTAGCGTQIPLTFRVRTSSNPITGVGHFPDICTGSTIELNCGYDAYASIRVDSVGSTQITTLGVTDTIFLPDGVNCPPYGYSYRSPVTFTSFNPTAHISNPDDILYVRLYIEHSYIGDILIQLTCPNGNTAIMLPDYQTYHWSGTTYAYFGLYYEPDGGGCNPASNVMGTGWDYCWSSTTNQGYTYASGQGFVYEPANIGGVVNRTVNPTDVANMTQVYHPYQDFGTYMNGCSLNGTWYIEVQDTWGSDNGYIFGWELALNPRLLPQDWTYNVLIDTVIYTGPGVNGSYVVPEQSGNLNYIATVIDEYGCAYDTNFNVNVIQSPRPDLGEDIGLCAGELFYLESNFSDSTAVYQWNTGSTSENIYVLSEGEYILNVTTNNADSSLVCNGSDTILIYIDPQPICEFEASSTESCSPLKLLFNNLTTPDSINLTYDWRIYNLDGSLVFSSALKNPEVTITEPGDYHVQLLVISEQGCQDSLMKWNYLHVYAQPMAEFAANPEISLLSENDGAVAFTNYADSLITSASGTSWFWDFGDGIVDSSEFSPTHTYETWGDYNVTLFIETEHGCIDEIIHTVVIEADLIFPNVITPNGDGFNDVFAITNLNTKINPEDPDEYRTNTLDIYDRWGKKVYQADNYDTFMKGEELTVGSKFFDGHNLNDGVYYFTFYYKGKAKIVNYHGTLNIIR